MKLKYIFASIVATLALAVGCQKEADHYLKDIQVSSSYLGFPAEGGSVDVTVTSTQEWTINSIPEWITATPAYGSAGVTTVKFTALAAEETREVSFAISCGNVKQTINVIQVTEAVEPTVITVAEAIKMIQADQTLEQTIYVKGVVCQIDEISPSYGNATYYLSDDGSKKGSYGADGKGDGNWLEIYRGAWLNGAKFTKGDEFSVGDEMVVCGVLMSYKGTPETKEKTAYVVSIEKSLIGIESVELLDVEEGEGVTEYPKEGGSIKVNLTLKGADFHVLIPDEAKSWLHIEDFGLSYVTLAADANEGGDRDVTVTCYTEEKGKLYTCQQKLTQKGSIINATVAEFLAAEVGNTQYRVSGVISKVLNTSYGNVNIKDYSGEVYVYGIGAKGDFEKLGLKEGDVVTLVGKRGESSGTARMTGAQLENSFSVTKKTVAELRELSDDKTTYYMVTGKVARIEETNADWDITKSGKFHIKDETGSIYVYKVATGWAGPADQFGTLEVKEGDTITIIGYRTSYTKNDYKLLQIAGGVYISHESGEGGGGGEGGDTGSPVTITTSVTGFPTAYPTTETAYKLGSIDYYLMNVANYGSGIQFKKGGSYLANKTSFGKIVKIECVWQEGKDFHPENFTLTVGSAEKPTATAITPTTDATALTAVYTVTGTNGFFMMKNDSGYAGYWSSIKVYFEEVN